MVIVGHFIPKGLNRHCLTPYQLSRLATRKTNSLFITNLKKWKNPRFVWGFFICRGTFCYVNWLIFVMFGLLLLVVLLMLPCRRHYPCVCYDITRSIESVCLTGKKIRPFTAYIFFYVLHSIIVYESFDCI